MDREAILVKTKEVAVAEIEKYGLPSRLNFDTSHVKAIELSKKLGADEFIVQMGVMLMDYKLGEALDEGKLSEHVKMSSESARDFLNQFDLDNGTVDKIINCIEGHHGKVEWKCLEAEICANADAYRFVLVKNWLEFLFSLGVREEYDFTEALAYAEEKFDEKWNIISLDVVREELEPHHKIIKEIIAKAK